MPHTTSSRLLILGGNGQIGRMWRHLWKQGILDFGRDPVWQVRSPADRAKQTLIWDILRAPVPDITPSAVICLAGVTAGEHVAMNSNLARAAVAVAKGAPVLFASTQAVYGRQPGRLTESAMCRPDSAYGQSKWAAEQAVAHYPNVTSLRIGNAIGADSLLRAAQRGPVRLDQFRDGTGPQRMMIGPLTLGRACMTLLASRPLLEPTLNLAQPGLIAMADLLDAAGVSWSWQPAPDTAIPKLEMDLRAVQNLVTLPMAHPTRIIAEIRAAGWCA